MQKKKFYDCWSYWFYWSKLLYKIKKEKNQLILILEKTLKKKLKMNMNTMFLMTTIGSNISKNNMTIFS